MNTQLSKEAYIAIGSLAKEIARHESRTRQILNDIHDRKQSEAYKEEVLARIARIDLEVKTAEFEFEKIDPVHPKYEAMKKATEEKIERYQKSREDEGKVMASIEKTIKEIDEKIEKVASGEIKMDLGRIETRAKELIADHFSNEFFSLATSADTGLKVEVVENEAQD